MAKSTLTPAEFIQNSFSPFIAVLSSPLVDEICQKNNLSFIELLEPFCTSSKEVCYKEPSGNIISLKNFQIVLSDVNSKPPEAAVARRFLNESVSSTSDENVDLVTMKSGNITVQIPSTIPWFEKWRTTFLRVQFPSDHEFTKHYLACMIVITSQDDNPMDTLSTKVQQLQQLLSMSPPKMMPKWFSSSVLRYYVLLHDTSSGDVIKAEKVYDEMKSTYSANCCYMLKINSLPRGKGGIDLSKFWKKFKEGEDNIQDANDSSMTNSFASLTGESSKFEIGQDVAEEPKQKLLIHPLSPELESQRLFNNGAEMNGPVECCAQLSESCLSSEDIDHIKMLVSHFVVNALMPFVETQMQYLNEMVFNKKGVSKSLFSVPRRWFGGPKPGSPVSVPNAHYYHPDSPELQMRRLGDLCFMFGAYSCAFQAYHSVKRDFNNDGAWLYYAGALEMAALSAFLIGQDLKKAQEYTDEGVLTYLQTCRMPQFATRLTLCATECLKALCLFGEAAGKLLQMTSEESDLRSALLLEEASYCFLKSRKPPMPRKYAFHLVLAGHRFAKASQKKHALRCYRQAYQVYKNNNWGLAEDHIHFTIGKLASALKEREVTAAEFAKLFTKPSAQLPAQQAIFLKEYFLSLIELQKENNENISFLEVPRVDHSSIKVTLNTLENEESVEGYILAGKNMSEDELSDIRWGKLEEKLYSHANKSSIPMFFKHSINIFSSYTNNSVKPTCVVAEHIRMSVDLVNILNIPLSLKKLELMWMHSILTEDPLIDKKVLVETEVIDSVSLDPDSTSKISLHITPKTAGELHITGITYTVILPPASDGSEPLQITGHTLLTPQGMRVVSTKDQKTAPIYLPDYRLQLVAVNNVPRLKVHLKNVPSEMLCGEVKEISAKLQNVGSLPIQNVFFTSSEQNCFSVPLCASANNIFSLINEPILPGHSTEVTIFLRGCDKSGRVSIDLLFYCNVDKSSQQMLKYRLIHHTLHLLIHESVFASALVSRSVKVTADGDENVNIKLQVYNKNQFYDSVKFVLYVHHISLFSSHWKLVDVISSMEKDNICLEQEQAAFLTLRAQRMQDHNGFSNLILCVADESISPTEKPYVDFAQFVIDKVTKNPIESSKNCGDYLNLKNIESAVTLNSLLIIFWKAELKNTKSFVFGQHHIPLVKLLQKYTSSEVNNLNDTQKTADSVNTFNTPSIASLYYSEPAAKELVLIRFKHPSFVRHSFTSKRICSVPVELLIQNCCDNAVEVKLDTTYQTNSSVSKINEFSTFLWMGLVLHTFALKEHSCITMRLSACFGNSGTYDLTSHFSVSARKDNNQVFVPQVLISHSLLCITNEIL